MVRFVDSVCCFFAAKSVEKVCSYDGKKNNDSGSGWQSTTRCPNGPATCIAICKLLQTMGYKVRHVVDGGKCEVSIVHEEGKVKFDPNTDYRKIVIALMKIPPPDVICQEVDSAISTLFMQLFKSMMPKTLDKVTFWTIFSTLLWGIINSIVSLIRDKSALNITLQSVTITMNLASIILHLCNYYLQKSVSDVAITKLTDLIVNMVTKGEAIGVLDGIAGELTSGVDHSITKLITDHALEIMQDPSFQEHLQAVKDLPDPISNESALGITATAVEIAISVVGIGLSIFCMATGSDIDKLFNRAVDLQKNAEWSRKKVSELAHKVAYQWFGLAIGDQAEIIQMIDQYQKEMLEVSLKDPQYFAVNTQRYYDLKELVDKVQKFRTFNLQHADASIRPLFQNLSNEFTKLTDLLRRVEQCLASSSIRPETVPFFLVGEDGTGKSWFAENKLCDAINQHFGEPRGKIFKLSWGANDHWKEPYGGEACAIQDEFLSTGHKHPMINHLNSVCSSAYFNMAGAFIKNQPCRFRALFLISNTDSCDLSDTLTPEAAIAFWSRMIVFKCRRPPGWEIDRTKSRHDIQYGKDFQHLLIDVHTMKRDHLGGLGPCVLRNLTADQAAEFALELVKRKDKIFKQLAVERNMDETALNDDGHPKPIKSQVDKKEPVLDKKDNILTPTPIQTWDLNQAGAFVMRNQFKGRDKLLPQVKVNKKVQDLVDLLTGPITENADGALDDVILHELQQNNIPQFYTNWKLSKNHSSLAAAIVIAEFLDYKIAFIDIHTNLIRVTKPTFKVDPIHIYYDSRADKDDKEDVFFWDSEIKVERVNETQGQDKFVICFWGEPRQGKTQNSYKLANELSSLLQYPVVPYIEWQKHDPSTPAIYVVGDQCNSKDYSVFYDTINGESIIINSGNFRVHDRSWYARAMSNTLLGTINLARSAMGSPKLDEAFVRTITGLEPEAQCDGILRRIGLVGKLRLISTSGKVYEATSPHWGSAEFKVDGGIHYHTDENGEVTRNDFEKMKAIVWSKLVRFRKKTSKLVIVHDPGLQSVPRQEWDVHIKVESRQALYNLLKSETNILKGYFQSKTKDGELLWGVKISNSLLNCKTRAFSTKFFLAPSTVKSFEDWIAFAERTYLALRSDYAERTVLVEAGDEKICGIENIIKYTGLEDTRVTTDVSFDSATERYLVKVNHTGGDTKVVYSEEVTFDANEVFNITNFGFGGYVQDERFSKLTITQMLSIKDSLKQFANTAPVKEQENRHKKRQAIQDYVRNQQKSLQDKFSDFVHSSGFKFACIGMSMVASAGVLAGAITGIVKLSRPNAVEVNPLTLTPGVNSGLKFEIQPFEDDKDIECVCISEVNIRASDIIKAMLQALCNSKEVVMHELWLTEVVDVMWYNDVITDAEWKKFYDTLYGTEIYSQSQDKRKKKGNNKERGGRKVNVTHKHLDGPGNSVSYLIDNLAPGGYRLIGVNQNESLETCLDYSTPIAEDKAMSAVQANMVGVTCYANNGTFLGRNWALAVKDKFLVTVAHLIYPDPTVSYEAEFTVKENGVPIHRRYVCSVHSVDRDNEIAVLQLPKHAPSFRNIMSYVVSEKQLDEINWILVSKPIVTKLGVTFNTRSGQGSLVKHTVDEPFTSSGANNVYKTKGHTLWSSFVQVDYSKSAQPFTRPGDCGMPYFMINASNDVSTLCGMHVAGANGHMSTSYAIVLTKEYLDVVLYAPQNQTAVVSQPPFEAMMRQAPKNGASGVVWERLHAALTKDSDVEYCVPLAIEPILQEAFETGDLTIPFEFMKSPEMSFLVTLEKLRGVNKSKLMKYPWSKQIEQFIPNLVKPAPLSVGQLTHEARENLPKDYQGRPSLSASQLIKITDDYRIPDEIVILLKEVEHEYVPHLRKCFDDHPFRAFNDLEAINGPIAPSDPLYGTVEPIDQETAPGFIAKFVHGKTTKKPYFRPQKRQSCTGKVVYEFDLQSKQAREMHDMLACVHEHGLNGIRCVLPMCDSLKDETLPIEKADKGGTRIISGADMNDVLFVRMAFGSLLGVSKKYRSEAHCQVGLDPHSEFHFLYSRLLRTGSNFIDGDFSRYDKHLLRLFLKALFRCWARLMAPTFGEEIHNLAKVVAAGLIDAVRVTEGHIWVQHRGLPSGHPLTCLVNSGVNDLMFFVALKYSFIDGMRREKFARRVTSESRSIAHLCKHVDFVNLGDDLLIVLDNLFTQIVSFKTLQHFYRLIGIEFDTADKDGTSYTHKRGSATKFLSRKFKAQNTPVMGVIKPESISSIAHWGKKMSADQFQNVINDLLTEGGKMDEPDFANIREALNVIQQHIPADKREEIPEYLTLRKIASDKVFHASYCRPDRAKNRAKMAHPQEKTGLTSVNTQAGVMAFTTVSSKIAQMLQPQDGPPRLPPSEVKGARTVPNEEGLLHNVVFSFLQFAKTVGLKHTCIAFIAPDEVYKKIIVRASSINNVSVKLIDCASVKALDSLSNDVDSPSASWLDETHGSLALVDNESLQNSITFEAMYKIYAEVAKKFDGFYVELKKFGPCEFIMLVNQKSVLQLTEVDDAAPVLLTPPFKKKSELAVSLLRKYFGLVKVVLEKTGNKHVCVTTTENCELQFRNISGIRTHDVHYPDSTTFTCFTDKNVSLDGGMSLVPIISFTRSFTLDEMWYWFCDYVTKYETDYKANIFCVSTDYQDRMLVVSLKDVTGTACDEVVEENLDWSDYYNRTLPIFKEDLDDPMKFVTFDLGTAKPNLSHICWLLKYFSTHVYGRYDFDMHHMVELIAEQELSDHYYPIPPDYEKLRDFSMKNSVKIFFAELATKTSCPLITQAAEMFCRHGLPQLTGLIDYEFEHGASEQHLYNCVQTLYLLGVMPRTVGSATRKYQRHWLKLSNAQRGQHSLIVREQEWKVEFTKRMGNSNQSMGHVAPPTDVINADGTANVSVPMASFDDNKQEARDLLMQGPKDIPMTLAFGGVVSTLLDGQAQWFEDGNTIEIRTNAAQGTFVWTFNLDVDRIPQLQFIVLMLHKRAKLAADTKIEMIGPPNVYGSLLTGLVPFYIDRQTPPQTQELLFYQNKVVPMNQTAVYSYNLNRIVPEGQTSVYWDNMADLIKDKKRGPTAYTMVWVPLNTVFNNVSAPVYLRPYCRLSPSAVYSFLDFGAVTTVYRALQNFWEGTTPSGPNPNSPRTILDYNGKTIKELLADFNIDDPIVIATNGNKTMKVAANAKPIRTAAALDDGIQIRLHNLQDCYFKLGKYYNQNLESIAGTDADQFAASFHSEHDTVKDRPLPFGDLYVLNSGNEVNIYSLRGGFDEPLPPQLAVSDDPLQFLIDGDYFYATATTGVHTDPKIPFLDDEQRNVLYRSTTAGSITNINSTPPDTDYGNVITSMSFTEFTSSKSYGWGHVLALEMGIKWDKVKDGNDDVRVAAALGKARVELFRPIMESTKVIRDPAGATSLPNASGATMVRVDFSYLPISAVTSTDHTQTGPIRGPNSVFIDLCENYLAQFPQMPAVEFTLQLIANSSTLAVVRYYRFFKCLNILTSDAKQFHDIAAFMTNESVRIVNAAGVDTSSVQPQTDVSGWTSYFVLNPADGPKVARAIENARENKLTKAIKALKMSNRGSKHNEGAALGFAAQSGGSIAGTMVNGAFNLGNTMLTIEGYKELASMGYAFQAQNNKYWTDFTGDQNAMNRVLYDKWQNKQLEYQINNANLASHTSIAMQNSINATSQANLASQQAWQADQTNQARTWALWASGVTNPAVRAGNQMSGTHSFINKAITAGVSGGTHSDANNGTMVDWAKEGLTIKEITDKDDSANAGFKMHESDSKDNSNSSTDNTNSSNDDQHASTSTGFTGGSHNFEDVIAGKDVDFSNSSHNLADMITGNHDENGSVISPAYNNYLANRVSTLRQASPAQASEPAGGAPKGSGTTGVDDSPLASISQKEEQSDASNDLAGNTHPFAVQPLVRQQVFDGGPLARDPNYDGEDLVIDAKNHAVNTGSNNFANQQTFGTGNVRSKTAIFNNTQSSPISPITSIPLSTYTPAVQPAGHGIGDYGINTTSV